MEKKKFRFTYTESFDTLRGFGTILVLLAHGLYETLQGAYIAVDMFFILSGYLITSLLIGEYIKTGRISLSKFYIRRGLRLVPALVIAVILANILWNNQTLYTGTNRLIATCAALFYFTNLIPTNISGNMVPLWSLSVEEHFYFFWPIIASFFVFRLSLRKRVAWLIAAMLAVTIFKIVAFHQNWQWGLFVIDTYRFTFCKIDAIIMGVLLALTIHKFNTEDDSERNKTKSVLLIVVPYCTFLLICYTLFGNNKFWDNGGFILTNILCTYIIFTAVRYSNHWLYNNKMLQWIGKRSYGMYIYHFPIFLATESLREHHNIPNLIWVNLLRFVLTFALAAFTYHYIELPLLNYKKKFEVQKTPHDPK